MLTIFRQNKLNNLHVANKQTAYSLSLSLYRLLRFVLWIKIADGSQNIPRTDAYFGMTQQLYLPWGPIHNTGQIKSKLPID